MSPSQEKWRSQSDLVDALLYTNYLVASWLAGELVQHKFVDRALELLPIMGAAYGEEHGAVLMVRIAALSHKIEGSSEQNQVERNRLCQELTVLADAISVKARKKPHRAQLKLAGYFEPGGSCGKN